MIRKNYLPAKSLDLILIPQSEDQIKKNGLHALILALSPCLAGAEDQRAPWEGGASSDRASNTTCTVTVHKLRQPWTPPNTHMHTRTHAHTPSHRDACTGPGLVLALPQAGCVKLCHFPWTLVSPPITIRLIIDPEDAFWLLQFGIQFFLFQPLPPSFKPRLTKNKKSWGGVPQRGSRGDASHQASSPSAKQEHIPGTLPGPRAKFRAQKAWGLHYTHPQTHL